MPEKPTTEFAPRVSPETERGAPAIPSSMWIPEEWRAGHGRRSLFVSLSSDDDAQIVRNLAAALLEGFECAGSLGTCQRRHSFGIQGMLSTERFGRATVALYAIEAARPTEESGSHSLDLVEMAQLLASALPPGAQHEEVQVRPVAYPLDPDLFSSSLFQEVRFGAKGSSEDCSAVLRGVAARFAASLGLRQIPIAHLSFPRTVAAFSRAGQQSGEDTRWLRMTYGISQTDPRAAVNRVAALDDAFRLAEESGCELRIYIPPFDNGAKVEENHYFVDDFVSAYKPDLRADGDLCSAAPDKPAAAPRDWRRMSSLLLMGRARPGLVADVFSCLDARGVEVVEADMTVLMGRTIVSASCLDVVQDRNPRRSTLWRRRPSYARGEVRQPSDIEQSLSEIGVDATIRKFAAETERGDLQHFWLSWSAPDEDGILANLLTAFGKVWDDQIRTDLGQPLPSARSAISRVLLGEASCAGKLRYRLRGQVGKEQFESLMKRLKEQEEELVRQLRHKHPDLKKGEVRVRITPYELSADPWGRLIFGIVPK